jgi:hypothetical protein
VEKEGCGRKNVCAENRCYPHGVDSGRYSAQHYIAASGYNRDGRELHVKLPASLSPIPEPAPSHILLAADGEILAYLFKGSDFGLPIEPTDSIFALDPESPDECPVYRET